MDDRIETDIPAPEIKAEAREVDWHKLNRLYVTRQLKRVQECGHRFDESQEPKNNCEFCFFAWFTSHGELVQNMEQCYQEAGRDVLERIKGKKITKFFLRYLATVAKFIEHQKELGNLKEHNGTNR